MRDYFIQVTQLHENKCDKGHEHLVESTLIFKADLIEDISNYHEGKALDGSVIAIKNKNFPSEFFIRVKETPEQVWGMLHSKN